MGLKDVTNQVKQAVTPRANYVGHVAHDVRNAANAEKENRQVQAIPERMVDARAAMMSQTKGAQPNIPSQQGPKMAVDPHYYSDSNGIKRQGPLMPPPTYGYQYTNTEVIPQTSWTPGPWYNPTAATRRDYNEVASYPVFYYDDAMSRNQEALMRDLLKATHGPRNYGAGWETYPDVL